MEKEITIVIFIFCAISIFIVGLLSKPKYGLYLIIFLMPLAGNALTIRYFNFSFISLLIFAFSFSYFFSKKITYPKIKKIKYKKYIILIFAAYCISLLSLLYNGLDFDVSYFGFIEENVTNYISTAVAGVFLYLIISMEISSLEQIFEYMRVFLFTLFFLALAVFLKNILHFPLPDFISPTYIIGTAATGVQLITHEPDSTGFSNFAGFLGYVENFGEYLFVLFAISTALLFNSKGNVKQRHIGLAGVILTLVFSIPTAIKAFPIMVGLFMILFLLFSKNIGKRFTIICFFVMGWVLFVYFGNYLKETYFFQRFYEIERRYAETGSNVNLYNFAYWIGRRDLITSFSDIIQTGGFLGIGPFVVWQLNGSNIPFHNLYYALYLNFGLIGFAVFVLFFLRIALDLFKICKNDAGLRNIAMLFLFMFVILLAEQIKVSSFRISFGIFMYWFLFALFASLQNLKHIQNPTFIQRREIV